MPVIILEALSVGNRHSRPQSSPSSDISLPTTLSAGQFVVVQVAAGPRLAGKCGVVLGMGATRTRVRVLLDGSKGPITLHARFLEKL